MTLRHTHLNSPLLFCPKYPGHKYSYFEGGIRTSAFVHSPLLPAAVVGTATNLLCHVSDWWVTFNVLAGVNPDDGYAAAPPDGVNLWPMLTAGSEVRGTETKAKQGIYIYIYIDTD